jgi:hypothetical protein
MALAGAIAIGEYLGNMSLGYLIMGVLFLLFSFIVYLIRSHINSKIISSMADEFFDK